VERDEYIESFFKAVTGQLAGAKLDRSGRSAHYKEHVVTARWCDQWWDIELTPREGEPIRRHYDPYNARSSEEAANYFVDALLRSSGEEPVPRAVVFRGFRRRA
jgi:hypothetical protein